MVDEHNFSAEGQHTVFTKATNQKDDFDLPQLWHQIHRLVKEPEDPSSSIPYYSSCGVVGNPDFSAPATVTTFNASRVTDYPYQQYLVHKLPEDFRKHPIDPGTTNTSIHFRNDNLQEYLPRNETEENEPEKDDDHNKTSSDDEEAMTFDFEETISRQEGERMRILRSQKQQHHKTNRRRSHSIILKPAWQHSNSGIQQQQLGSSSFTPTYESTMSLNATFSEATATPLPTNTASASEHADGSSKSTVMKHHRTTSFSTNRRQIVCRHWIRGMCWKGDYCEFLHQYDMEKMPVCRVYAKTGQCQDHDRGVCIFLHEKFSEDVPICVHYYLGFCRAGPKCRKRHQKLTVDDLPKLVPDWYLQIILENANAVIPRQIDEETENILEQVEKNCRALTSTAGTSDFHYSSSNSNRQQKHSNSTPISRGNQPTAAASASSSIPKTVNLNLENDNKPNVCKIASGATTAAAAAGAETSLVDSTVLEKAKRYGIPYVTQGNREPDGSLAAQKHRIFMIKSNDLANIQKSVRLGIWASGKHNTKVLREAYLSSSHVVLLFSANESGGFQGYGKMMTLPTPDLYPNAWGVYSSRLGNNFRVRWLKQTRVDFEKFGRLTNPLNDNQPIRKSRDCQEIPFSLAAIICTVLSSQPDDDLLEGSAEESKPRIDHTTFFDLSESDRKQIEVELRLPESIFERASVQYATPHLLPRKQYKRNTSMPGVGMTSPTSVPLGRMLHGALMTVPVKVPSSPQRVVSPQQQQVYGTSYRELSSSVPSSSSSSFLEMCDLPLLDLSTSSVKLALQQLNSTSSGVFGGKCEGRKAEPYVTTTVAAASKPSSPPHTYAALRALPQALRQLRRIT